MGSTSSCQWDSVRPKTGQIVESRNRCPQAVNCRGRPQKPNGAPYEPVDDERDLAAACELMKGYCGWFYISRTLVERVSRSCGRVGYTYRRRSRSSAIRRRVTAFAADRIRYLRGLGFAALCDDDEPSAAWHAVNIGTARADVAGSMQNMAPDWDSAPNCHKSRKEFKD